MRIATSMLFSNAVTNMNTQESQILQLQQEVSTGQKITNPGDDPVGAAAAVRINQQISRSDDLKSNRQTAESQLNTVSTTLSSVTTLLTNVKSELVAAGNGSYDSSQRQFLASQLQGQLQQLTGYANAQDGSGEYLFSGYQSTTQPFVAGNFVSSVASPTNSGSGSLTTGTASLNAAFPGNALVTVTGPNVAGGFNYTVSGLPGGTTSGTTSASGQFTLGGASFTLNGTPAANDSFSLNPAPVQYQGDSGTRSIEVAEGRHMNTNLTGNTLFGQIPSGNGAFATSAQSGNTGSGLISGGTVTSTTALTKDQYQINFTGPGSVVASGQNSGTGSVAVGSISGTPANQDKLQLTFAVSGGVTTYSLLDNTTGQAVGTPQPFTAGAPITVNGVQFSIAGTPGSGDSFTVGPGPATSYSVTDLTKNTTVLSNQTYTSGNAIQFDGMSMAITGTPNTADQFSVAPSTQTNVFATMQAAINALNGSGSGLQSNTVLANALATANSGIDAAQTQISLGQTTVGGRLNELSSLDSSGASLVINYKATLAQYTNVDMTSAISDLSQAQISLTAAQKSFVQVQNLSLFSYIQ